MAPFFTGLTRGIGGGGFGSKRRKQYNRGGVAYKVFYSPNTLDLSSYEYIFDLSFLKISSGTNGIPGGAGSPSAAFNGGFGGSGGSVSYQMTTYESPTSPQPINTSPSTSYGSVLSGPNASNYPNPSANSISVPTTAQSAFPGFAFTPQPGGANGIQPSGDGWDGDAGGGGAGGIAITASAGAGFTIPSVSGGTGANGQPSGRPGGGGAFGGSGYGAGGGGGGGGGELDGDQGAGGAGGSGAPGIIIVKINYGV
jgi:hypothetical protein